MPRPSLVRPAALAHHQLDVEDLAAGAELLSTNELGEHLDGLDSDLPGRNGDHRQRRLDERGGRRIRCTLPSIDFDTGDTVGACSGNWLVNGGTADYLRLRGTGTFTETQNLNYQGVGTGSITLVGTMHTD
jgi:hypothetical protein